MSDPFDVSLRVKLERSGFSEGKTDLNELKKAADGLARTDGPERLNRNLREVNRAATATAQDMQRAARQAAQLGGGPGPAKLTRQLHQAAVEGKAVASALSQVDQAARRADRDHLGRFSRSAAETTTNVRGLEAAIGKADKQAAAAFDRDRYGRFNRGTDEAGRHLDRLRQKMHDIARTETGLRSTGNAAEFLTGSVKGAAGALAAFAAPTAIIAGLSQVQQQFRDIDLAAARIALTAETPEKRSQIIASSKKMAPLGASPDDIMSARAVYTSQLGEKAKSIEDQNAMLEPALKAQVATGIPARTYAGAVSSYINTMGGKPSEATALIDMMAKGGKLGSFEGGAIAQNLPQLGSQYAASGGTGLKGVSELIAMAQVAAIGSGSEGEAATNLTNFLSTLYSPETVENFKKRGISVRAVSEGARARGQHPAMGMLEVVDQLTDGGRDQIGMGKLFGNQQAASALRPLIQNREKLTEFQRQIEHESKGTIDADHQYITTETPSGRELVRQSKREASQLTVGEGTQGISEWFSGVQSRAIEHLAGITEMYKDQGAFGAFAGAAGIKSTQPATAEDQDLENLRNERADLERELSLGALTGADSKPLQDRLDRLTSAIRDLEKRFSGEDAKAGSAEPISLRGTGLGSGRARIWNASLGSNRRRPGTSPADDESMIGPGGGSSRGASARGAGAASVQNSGPVSSLATTRNPGGGAGEVYDVLSSGLPDHQALALLGHIDQESGFDPGAWNAKESAGGLIQWRGNRLENLKQYAAQRGMPWQDRKTQSAFILHEMKNDPYERQQSEAFRNAGSIEEASAALKSYIRFGDSSGGTRLSKGRQWSEKFGAQATVSSGAAAAAGGAGKAAVSYTNQTATRNRPVAEELEQEIARGVSAVYGEGYRAEIYSGGQDAKGKGRRRVGTTRHDDEGEGGKAADVYVVGPDGQRVRGDALGRLGQHWAATKQGGVGMEMRDGGIHLDLHKNKAPHWNYAGKGGGRYTAGQREAMRLGLAGIPPAYLNPGALSDNAVSDGAAALSSSLPMQAPTPSSRPEKRPQQGPAAPPAAGRGSSGNMTVTQNFHGGFDAGAVYRRSQRESGRAIRAAEARALHDTIAPTA